VSTALRILDPIDDFPGLLSGIDVFVTPSRTKGFPYAIIEAMAAGKLILSSDIPGIREIYRELPGVWLFPSEDWRTLGELMQRATALSHTQREHRGRANSRYVTEHLSVEVLATQISAAYSRLLNNRSGTCA
jgi:glycosyltransferase involved in cell wall biosynthesis